MYFCHVSVCILQPEAKLLLASFDFCCKFDVSHVVCSLCLSGTAKIPVGAVPHGVCTKLTTPPANTLGVYG